MKVKDLVGKEFGRLVVLNRVEDPTKQDVLWRCRCRCGTEKVLGRRDLLHHQSPVRSCGCLKAEVIRKRCWKGVGLLGRSLWNQIRGRAASRGVVFEVTIEQAWELFEQQGGKCALTGERLIFPKSSGKKHRATGTASLDRIDSAKGYFVDNIQWVHKRVNVMKNKWVQDEFIAWCRKVALYMCSDLAKS